jgi:hypothetical protein
LQPGHGWGSRGTAGGTLSAAHATASAPARALAAAQGWSRVLALPRAAPGNKSGPPDPSRHPLPDADAKTLQHPAAAQASRDGIVTLWVKVVNTAGARQYAEVSGVDVQAQSVSEFKARLVAQEELGVRPASVTLRLVAVAPRKPPDLAELVATELADPSVTLAEAGVSSTAWLLAVVDAPPGPPREDVAALEAALRELQLATQAQRAELADLRERTTHLLPVSIQQLAARCLFQLRLTRDGSCVGVGVLFKRQLAVTAGHNLGRDAAVGSPVFGRVINHDDTEAELEFEVAVRNNALDVALLHCTTPYEHFLEPYTGMPAELLCSNMALCAFQSAIHEELPEFKHRRIGVFHALCSKLSTNNTHLLYQLGWRFGRIAAAV